jgi:hypothetical protein
MALSHTPNAQQAHQRRDYGKAHAEETNTPTTRAAGETCLVCMYAYQPTSDATVLTCRRFPPGLSSTGGYSQPPVTTTTWCGYYMVGVPDPPARCSPATLVPPVNGMGPISRRSPTRSPAHGKLGRRAHQIRIRLAHGRHRRGSRYETRTTSGLPGCRAHRDLHRDRLQRRWADRLTSNAIVVTDPSYSCRPPAGRSYRARHRAERHPDRRRRKWTRNPRCSPTSG